MNKFAILFALATMIVAAPSFADPPEFIPPGHQYGGSGGDAIADADALAASNSSSNSDADARSTATAVGTQQQSQNQASLQGNEQSVTFEDDVAASSAATLVLGTCQSGVSAQTIQGGGALGGPDEVCLLFTASQVAASQGRFELSNKLLDEAVDILKVRSNPVVRFLQGIPVIRKVM